jgi:hypothetical protein
MGLQKLFSVHISMSSAGLSKKLQKIEKVTYAQTPGGRKMEAALADLPLLVEKYETCLTVPRVKIMQLNDLAAISPMYITANIMELIHSLTEIGIRPPERVNQAIKNNLQILHAQLDKLAAVEAILKQHEQQLMPLLYEQRYSLKDANRPAPLPPLTKNLLKKRNANSTADQK